MWFLTDFQTFLTKKFYISCSLSNPKLNFEKVLSTNSHISKSGGVWIWFVIKLKLKVHMLLTMIPKLIIPKTVFSSLFCGSSSYISKICFDTIYIWVTRRKSQLDSQVKTDHIEGSLTRCLPLIPGGPSDQIGMYSRKGNNFSPLSFQK